jgi:hypothetical protein
MGKEKFLSAMFDCAASKVGLEPLVKRTGCEWTGTECAGGAASAGKGLE